MSGFPWLKLWNEAPDDPKWLAVAEMAGSSRPVVWYAFSKILTHANQNEDRGSITGLHPQVIAAWCQVPLAEVTRIFQAFRELGVLIGDRLAKWAKRQSEKVRSPVAERVAKHRRKKADAARQMDLGLSGQNVTPDVTSPVTGPPADHTQAIDPSGDFPSPLDEESDQERIPPKPPQRGDYGKVVLSKRVGREPEILLPIKGGLNGYGAGRQRRESAWDRRNREYDEAVAATIVARRMARDRAAAGSAA